MKMQQNNPNVRRKPNTIVIVKRKILETVQLRIHSNVEVDVATDMEIKTPTPDFLILENDAESLVWEYNGILRWSGRNVETVNIDTFGTKNQIIESFVID